MILNVEWRFRAFAINGTRYKCNFHVLDGLSCDVVLSSELLFATKAFEKFHDCFRKV